MRNRLVQESRAINCREIGKSRRICEETDQARQLRIELCMQQDRIPATVSQLTRIQDLQNWVTGQIRDNFRILKQRAALERSMFPVNP